MAKERTSSRKPPHQKENRDQQQLPSSKQEKWILVRTLLGCNHQPIEETNAKCKKMKPAATATAETLRRRPSSSLSSSSRSLGAPHPLNEPNCLLSSSNSFSAYSSRRSSSINGGSGSGTFRGMTGLRRLSGCYECRMVIDPVAIGVSREPSLRSTICACPQCGEIFMRPEIMELHLSH